MPIWTTKYFDELTLQELYAVLRLRQQVFIAEQNCVFIDADNKDQTAHHLLCINAAGELLAYTRLLPAGVAYENYASIGRVVTNPEARGTGLGRVLMQKSIEATYQLFGRVAIKIQAQSYLRAFYESLDFVGIGQDYIEDGIPHVDMVLKNK